MLGLLLLSSGVGYAALGQRRLPWCFQRCSALRLCVCNRMVRFCAACYIKLFTKILHEEGSDITSCFFSACWIDVAFLTQRLSEATPRHHISMDKYGLSRVDHFDSSPPARYIDVFFGLMSSILLIDFAYSPGALLGAWARPAPTPNKLLAGHLHCTKKSRYFFKIANYSTTTQWREDRRL